MHVGYSTRGTTNHQITKHYTTHTDHNTDPKTVNSRDRQANAREPVRITVTGFIFFTPVHKYHYINKHRHVDPQFVKSPLQVAPYLLQRVAILRGPSSVGRISATWVNNMS